MSSKKQYSVIDLFCGCGGFSLGFKQAGYDVKLGVDIWDDAIVTYGHNITNAKIINDDISTIDAKRIFNTIGKSNIDVIIGGPPCQGFSVSGKRMLDDPRNMLYKSYVRLVGEIKPKIFVMENVPGLVKLFDGKVKDNIISDFSALNYNVNYCILSAADYGVPQYRKRVFFVGLSKEIFGNTFFVFPTPTIGGKLITCKDAISDLDFISDNEYSKEKMEYKLEPSNDYQIKMRNNGNVLLNHSITKHTEKTKEIISMVPDGGNYKDLPRELQTTRKVHIAWTRMNSARPCFTIDTGHNHHFHYSANR
ncbi:MAG: DNA cytosine methyltransferase, partial [Bacteroidaceae bacterium]